MDRLASILLQMIPVMTMALGGSAAFLATSIPGLSLGRLGAGGQVIDGGLGVGTSVAALTLFFGAMVALIAMRWFEAPGSVHRDAALHVVLAGALGAAAVWGGSVYGGFVAGDGGLRDLSVQAGGDAVRLWPIAVVTVAMTVAVGLRTPPADTRAPS